MRKTAFLGFVLAGVTIGLLSSVQDDVATRTVICAIGALIGAAIGGAVFRIGRRQQPLEWLRDPIPGAGVTSEDLAANYWLDKGHPPFMKPPDGDASSRTTG